MSCAEAMAHHGGKNTLRVTTSAPQGQPSTWSHELQLEGVLSGLASVALAIGENVHVVAIHDYEKPTRLVFRRGGDVVEVELAEERITAMALFGAERRLVVGFEDGSLWGWRLPFSGPSPR